ncbi:MAG: hypothetical protein V5A79_08080 [Candidatus Bipolaricaulota bacterium]
MEKRKKIGDWNRRDILKKTGATAAGIVGFAGVSTASPEEREYAKSKRLSQVLLDALNNPRVTNATKKRLGSYTGYILHTDIGRLVYAEDGDNQLGAQFHIEGTDVHPGKGDGPNNNNERKNGYKINSANSRGKVQPFGQVVDGLQFEDIPIDGKATLIATGDYEIEFIRSASEQEQSKLESHTGIKSENALMFYSSPIKGFEVHSVDGVELKRSDSENASADTAGSEKTSEREIYYVKPKKYSDLSTVTVKSPNIHEKLSAQSQCETWAARCMESISVCWGCGLLCASVAVTNIPGVVACITCVMGCHYAVPASCIKVMDECQ